MVVDLSDITWVFSFGFCDKPDPNLPWREFRQQVFERAREVAELAISQRGPEYGGLDGKVNVKKYAILAIAAWMFSAEDLPLAQLPFALKPGTTEFDRILNTCRDPETRQALLEMAALWNPRRPDEFHRTVAPAERLIDELFNDETLRAYGEATADLEEVLKNKGIICFTGGTNEYTTRVILRSVWQRLIRVLKRHWKRSGEKPLPVLFAADECSTYTGEPEAQSLAECLKMMTDPDTGEGGFVLISQTPDFGSPGVNLKVSQCCSWKAFFHCAGLVAPLAAVELKGGLNPLQVKRVRKKVEHTGQFEAVKVYSQSKRKDKDGKDLVEERENTVFQPVYREVEEEELWSLSDLVHLADMGLQRLRVGECWVRDGAEVSFRKVPPPAPLWTFDGQGRRMLEEHARRQREQGVFRRVADTTPPLPPAPPASTPPSPAPSRPAAGTRRPPRGMS
ncbi:MAG TPA: hypothetical protein VD866_29500 [Urbifossiella sp.]|nr:hypothetical protein [Urbifossiella sp.]